MQKKRPIIKLLAIDLDGTLLSSAKSISPENLSAVQAAQKAGVIVVLASGRIAPSIQPFAEALGLAKTPRICGNGTLTYLSPSELLYRLPLPAPAFRSIKNYAWREGLHLNIYTPDELYFLRETPWGDLYRSRAETVVPKSMDGVSDHIDCIKVLVVAEPDSIQFHRDRILDLTSSHAIRATESEPEYLEFMDSRATKGHALASLAEHLGIQQSETAAIGDYLNDLEMLEFAGVSAAVENAHPLVKTTANMVVSSNDRSGVSEFIHQIVLKQYE